ncbi:MAG: fumarylacetoacetate hydrolase family protein [Solirubrobacterales bacterium]|nr:fumarylacetoacetate hydrolase family protein [Solirubrobacterales bacterium]
MRFVTFATGDAGRPLLRAGVLSESLVIDIDHAIVARGGNPVAGSPATGSSALLTLIRGGDAAVETAREATEQVLAAGDERRGDDVIIRPLDEVQLVAPLPRPNSLRDYLVVEEHLRNCVTAGLLESIAEEWFNIPAHYKGNVDEIYGPDDTVPWPAYTDKLDYELEICAVIGTPGRRITAADAGRHIFGYTLYNDWSARDIQGREMSVGTGPGICKDFGSSIGPCIATPDEFDRDTARLEARIDGEVWSSGVLGAMHFSFEEIIEWTSQEETLRPGDLLGSGTVGRGCGAELDRWLTQGCVVELEAEGIGVLRNRVGLKGAGPTRVIEVEAAV